MLAIADDPVFHTPSQESSAQATETSNNRITGFRWFIEWIITPHVRYLNALYKDAAALSSCKAAHRYKNRWECARVRECPREDASFTSDWTETPALIWERFGYTFCMAVRLTGERQTFMTTRKRTVNLLSKMMFTQKIIQIKITKKEGNRTVLGAPEKAIHMMRKQKDNQWRGWVNLTPPFCMNMFSLHKHYYWP